MIQILRRTEDFHLGIFYKDCPHCATTHTAAADLCGCGYVFSGEKLDEPDLAPELAAQEEKLYEAYLAARFFEPQRFTKAAFEPAVDLSSSSSMNLFWEWAATVAGLPFCVTKRVCNPETVADRRR